MPCRCCKKAGHNIKTCRARLCEENNENEGLSEEVLKDRILRARLPNKDVIWKYRNDSDAYTTCKKEDLLDQDIERDHVVEIQLLEAAFDAYLSSPYTNGRILRSEKANVVDLANCLQNSNNTTKIINRTKKGPFTRAKNEWIEKEYNSHGCKGIDSYIFTSGRNSYSNIPTNVWSQIKKEVVVSYDYITEKIPSAIRDERNSEILADHIQDMFISLQIEP